MTDGRSKYWSAYFECYLSFHSIQIRLDPMLE